MLACTYQTIRRHILQHLHPAFYLTTGPQPLPKRVLHIAQSSASSCIFQYLHFFQKSLSSRLRITPRLPVTSIFSSKMCFRMQFLHKKCPNQLAFLRFITHLRKIGESEYQLSHVWTDFQKIYRFFFFEKSVRKVQVSSKSDQNNGHFTRRPTYNYDHTVLNRLTPNDPYMGRTAPLTSKLCISYIYSTNIGTEYIKHALYSPFFLFKTQFVS